MLDEVTLNKLKNILFRYISTKDYSLFIFGSRAMDKNKKYSDIDIGVEGSKRLDLKTLARIQDAFEESDLPYTIDVVDFTMVSDRFRQVAKKASIPLN